MVNFNKINKSFSFSNPASNYVAEIHAHIEELSSILDSYSRGQHSAIGTTE